ncbi:MAG: hypothetical protein WCT37_04740 [Patescibacteria group bacterium]|jgi:hypothetical protein
MKEDIQPGFIPSKDIETPENRLEKEIRQRLKLYHQTTKNKWELIKRTGEILSESELLARGLIKPEKLDDIDSPTNTGEFDREVGRDQYVFASHLPAGYGNVLLEISPEALNIPEAKVATAGEFLLFADEKGRKFHQDSTIPASQFIKYLVTFLPKLPDAEWFWGKNDQERSRLLGQALMEQDSDKPELFRQLRGLHPEIMFPKSLPLKFIKNVTIDGEPESTLI